MAEEIRTLVLAEKTEQARALAEALSHSSYREKEENLGEGKTQKWFETDNKIMITPARGHLLDLKIRGIRTIRPLEEYPLTETYVDYAYSKDIPKKVNENHVNLIRDHSEKCDRHIIATDWDREGEVIGYRIFKKIGLADDPSEIERMYFSSLTEREIQRAYRDTQQMDEELLAQGMARSIDDTIFGLNITKALKSLFREEYGCKEAITGGRVQSPVLRHIFEKTGSSFREKADARVMVSEGWLHSIVVNGNSYGLSELPEENIDSVEVEQVKTETEKIDQAVPLPNTASVHRELEVNPDVVDSVLEQLYLSGLCTYPRTEGETIPEEMLDSLLLVLKKETKLPEDYSKKNYPDSAKKGKKPAITLTDLGARKFLREELRGEQRIIAQYLLCRLVRSISPPVELETVRITYSLPGSSREYEEDWSVKIKNPEQITSKEFTESLEEASRIRPEIKRGRYDVFSRHVLEGEYQIDKPAFNPLIQNLSDSEIVNWMDKIGIGTKATRSTYPPKLRRKNHLNLANMPTQVGAILAKIIQAIGLDKGLTDRVEKMISSVSALNDLPLFEKKITEITNTTIRKLEKVNPPKLTCPKGHVANLGHSLYGFYLECEECEDTYPA